MVNNVHGHLLTGSSPNVLASKVNSENLAKYSNHSLHNTVLVTLLTNLHAKIQASQFNKFMSTSDSSIISYYLATIISRNTHFHII